MAKKALPLLTGGLNELTRADLLDNTQLQISDNYEVIGDGTLKLRKEEETFSSALNTKLLEIFSEVIAMSEPYYPQKMLEVDSDAERTPVDDFVLFFYGKTSSETYELHMLFKYTDSSGAEQWENYVEYEGESFVSTLNELLISADILFTEDSSVSFTLGQNRVIVTDYVNNTFFIEIDVDGNVRTGVLGIPAPTNKATVTQLTEWRDELWENDSSGTRVSDPGLFQCTYTVITKYGEESNPAPLSETLDLQFFKLDDDSIDERWIEKIEIKDLSIPDVTDSILDSLDTFKIYMRVIRFSKGQDVKTLEFSQDFKIVNKVNNFNQLLTSGVTGNNYSITLSPEPGNIVSYEKDVAPIAKTSAELSGITMLGNIKNKISFPYDFKYFHKITINNADATGYVDAIIKIRLEESSIDNFIAEEFISDIGNITNTENIRIFDNDLTTPINCLFNRFEDSEDRTLTLYIKVPFLPPSSQHNLYLCWNSLLDVSYTGVPDAYQSFEYGKIFNVESLADIGQKVFTTLKVKSGDLLVDDFNGIYETLSNKADTSIERETAQEDGIEHIDSTENMTIPLIENLSVGGKAIEIQGAYSALNYNFNNAISFPDSGTTFVRIDFTSNNTPAPSAFGVRNIVTFRYTNDYFLEFSIMRSAMYHDGGNYYSLHIRGAEFDVEGTDTNMVYIGDFLNEDGDKIDINTKLKGMIAFSWDKTSSTEENRLAAYLYYKDGLVYKLATVNLKQTGATFSNSNRDGFADNYDEVLESDFLLFPEASYRTIYDTLNSLTTLNQVKLGVGAYDGGFWHDSNINSAGLEYAIYDDWVVQPNFFLNPDNVSHKDMFKNLANYMPGYDSIVGYKYSDDTYNNNISFDETKEIEFKERKTMLKWSDINAINFPDLSFKLLREPVLAIIPAPSFLQFEYKNTFLIFTRNSINRFILDGSASGWAGSVSSLIEEKTQYGLMAEKSLVRAGDAIFWLSEVGVVMWDSSGMKLISKNIVNVPLHSNSIAFYNSLRNQYLIQSAPDEIIPGDGGDDSGEESILNAIPGWNYGNTITIEQLYQTEITSFGSEEGSSWATIFSITGVSPELNYSNFLTTNNGNFINVPPIGDYFNPNEPTTIWEYIVQGNPSINIWNMVLLDGEPVGSEEVFLNKLQQSNGLYNEINRPIEYENAPTLSFNFPPLEIILDEYAILNAINQSECSGGNWFTSGSDSSSESILSPSGLLCSWDGINLADVSDVINSGFWYFWSYFIQAVNTGGYRNTTSVRETGESYSYDIGRGVWTKFTGVEKIKSSSILTGGNRFNNINLLLNSSNEVYKYPGENSVNSGKVRTKKIYFEKGTIRRVNLEHSSGTNNMSLSTNLEKYDSDGETIVKSNTIQNVKSKKWRGVPSGKNRGRAVSFDIDNADNIGTIGYDIRVEK